LIGGSGERKTLRLVAAYGDACNLYAGGEHEEYAEGLVEIRHKLEVLQRHCEAVDRPYSEIERTVLAGVHLAPGRATVSDVIALCRDLAELGVQHVIFNMPNVHELKPLEIFGREIIPAVAEL
jgi:hypothetical protein